MANLLKRLGEFFLDVIETIVIALSIFLVVYLLVLQPHQVNGQSMVPTFQSGEYVLTDKISYKFRDPLAGEVIVFHAPPAAGCAEGTGCDFIKRVLAVPGDSVQLRDSTFYVNGQPLVETYLPPEFETLPGDFTRGERVFTLGPDEYLAVGDNRPYSSDGRQWGPIQKSDIVGRAFFRYWPPQVVGILRKAEY